MTKTRPKGGQRQPPTSDLFSITHFNKNTKIRLRLLDRQPQRSSKQSGDDILLRPVCVSDYAIKLIYFIHYMSMKKSDLNIDDVTKVELTQSPLHLATWFKIVFSLFEIYF